MKQKEDMAKKLFRVYDLEDHQQHQNVESYFTKENFVMSFWECLFALYKGDLVE